MTNQIETLKAKFADQISDFAISSALLMDGELNTVSKYDIPHDLAQAMEAELKRLAKPLTLGHLRETARRSYSWISFSPDKRGDQVIKDYSEELDADLLTITAQALTDDAKASLQATLDRYKGRYESLLTTWLHSQSNCASSMVTGPSNFPVERQRKRSRWADNHYSAFREWRTKALKAIARDQKGPIDELALSREKLINQEKNHQLMLTANKIIRKGVNVIPQLAELGIDAVDAPKLITPDFGGRLGFATYTLTNSLARIKQYKARVAQLEARQASANDASNEIPFNGGRVVLNHQLDRLQLLYDAKPSAEIIAQLKSRGFRWSPFNKAWQRQLTDNAKHAAGQITGTQVFKQAA